MARYNTSLATNSISGTTTISSPYQGAFTELTGTAPYTITLPSPSLYPGHNQTFYNATSGTVTIATPTGTFSGAGGPNNSYVQCYTGTVISVTSDGTNYIVISEDGSPLVATTGLFSSDLTVNGASASVSITPGGVLTITPGAGGNINNVSIGASTRSSGAFTTLAANNQVTFTGNIGSSGTSSGTIVVTGGIGVSGNINSGGTITAVGLTGPLTGTIQTAAQPNITSLGTLTGLTVNTGSGATDANTVILTRPASSDYSGLTFRTGSTTNWSIGQNSNGPLSIFESGSAATTRFVVKSGGNVGINNNDPSYKLDVTGNFRVNNNGGSNPTFYVDAGDYGATQVLFEHTGTTTPVPFALSKSGYSGSSKDFGILYLDMAHNVTGGGANLHFTLRNSSNTRVEYAGLGGIITTNTAGSHGGALVMYTSNSGGTRNERVRVAPGGNVGINNTDPQAPLSFNTSTGNKIDFYHSTSGSGDRYGVQVQSSELRIHSGASGASDGGITLGKSTTSSFTEAMRVRNDTSVTIGNSAFSGGAVTTSTYTHFERTNSPQTITRTNWGKSSNMEANQYRGGPNYNMPFVVSFYTPNNESNSANTYYPVSFNTPGHGGGQFGNFVICRRYHDTGPAQRGGSGIGWNDSSTHQGGLEAWFHLGESAWSDYYSARLLYYRYTYHTTISDYGMMLTNDSRFGSGPFWIRLRGGFQYWIHSTFPCSPANVNPSGTVFYYPTEGNTYQTWPSTTTSVQNTNFNSNQYWGTL